MVQLLQFLIRAIQPLLVPLCFVFAWVIVILMVWSIWAAMRDTVARARQMHQIPCANCQFFTRDYHLKCTVHPSIALTEDAIDCPDFKSPGNLYRNHGESVHH
ncbi:hypothetical protein K9N68_12570 [Kovacikia minuta CCNUW1]|uniref:hypothetical protein n=1 Tax=Kovacikia minuta TaxID=2931930 RepID=UPI001CCA56B7|nr:hypothetical protein [Kovacikia minuta]UBF28633.1 hypothetical protein K9N68_12570 [Kovacikia minuta CCNUW1]